MKKLVLAAIALLVGVGSTVYGYDTGYMTCEDVGRTAAALVEAKIKGVTYKQALARINNIVPAKYRLERKNLKDLVRIIYKEEYGKHLSPDGAYGAMKADCMALQ